VYIVCAVIALHSVTESLKSAYAHMYVCVCVCVYVCVCVCLLLCFVANLLEGLHTTYCCVCVCVCVCVGVWVCGCECVCVGIVDQWKARTSRPCS
jgi:hypothetical protein